MGIRKNTISLLQSRGHFQQGSPSQKRGLLHPRSLLPPQSLARTRIAYQAYVKAGLVKNVFVSHVHEDDAEVARLLDDLKKRGYLARDYSITRDKDNNAKSPEYIKQGKLIPRLKAASAVLVLISSKTQDSYWVKWEVEYAKRHGKKIVGVWTKDHPEALLPTFLRDPSIRNVNWDVDQIVSAIEAPHPSRY